MELDRVAGGGAVGDADVLRRPVDDDRRAQRQGDELVVDLAQLQHQVGAGVGVGVGPGEADVSAAVPLLERVPGRAGRVDLQRDRRQVVGRSVHVGEDRGPVGVQSADANRAKVRTGVAPIHG